MFGCYEQECNMKKGGIQEAVPSSIKLDYPSELSVDWLSRSYPVTRLSGGMALAADKERLRKFGADIGVKSASLYGYVGVRSAGAFVGRREEGSVTRRLEILSGKTARNADLIPMRSGLKINRIDIQATMVLDSSSFRTIEAASKRVDEEIERILEHLLWFKTVNAKSVPWLERLKITTIKNAGSEGGMTLYVGSRSSDAFIRIYNKTAEAKIVVEDLVVPSLLRVEVELKDSYAASAYEYLVDCGSLTNQDDLSSLLNEFTSRVGIAVNAASFPRKWLSRVSRSRSNDRTLAWIEHTVKPTLERLIVDVGIESVAAALGKTLVEQLGLFTEEESSILESEQP